jgi:two-component system CheB/CheR fusion protein
MPYRTLDDRIDGVVITFADITVAKTLEAQLRKKHADLEEEVAGQSTKQGKDGNRASSDATARKRFKNEGKTRPSRKL